GALSPEGQAAFDRNSGMLGDAYHGLIRQGIEEGSVVPLDDVEARALMLPGLLSWLVKDDWPRDPAQQRHIAREDATLVEIGLRAPLNTATALPPTGSAAATYPDRANS